MSGQYRRGIELTCSSCSNHQNVYTPGSNRDYAEMWMRLLIVEIPNASAGSPGRSVCCGAQVTGKLFGY